MIRSRLPQPHVLADDGDERNFCSTCVFGPIFWAAGMDKSSLHDLHALVEHAGPYRKDEYIFRRGERFGAIFAMRGGVAKTRVIDDDGREQVLGFFLPGEVIGLDAIHPEIYPCDAIALDTVYVCRFSFAALTMLAAKLPDVQRQLFRLLSAGIGKATILAGDHTADERMAAFLLDLADRYTTRGFPVKCYRLMMPRTDIANHLRLATETVSRVLRRFCDNALIRVKGRALELLDVPRLRHLARNLRHD
ncbi:MAG: helix-turn-helix domain-containing protein [Rhodanobacter sp.]|jgi:CRP/FNR family transcriptional regulator|nr:helix-turn-helix domain-containing protein [Rhodanobacter sp.]